MAAHYGTHLKFVWYGAGSGLSAFGERLTISSHSSPPYRAKFAGLAHDLIPVIRELWRIVRKRPFLFLRGVHTGLYSATPAIKKMRNPPFALELLIERK